MDNKMYKTELCKNFEETGECKYTIKCQFAHSIIELRDVKRHPLYKTEVCKNYTMYGHCNYGIRCCFKHEAYKPENEEIEFKEFWEEAGDNMKKCKGKVTYWFKEKKEFNNNFNSCLKDDSAMIWNIDPLFYIGKKHKKFYETSAQNKAPGNPVLPNK